MLSKGALTLPLLCMLPKRPYLQNLQVHDDLIPIYAICVHLDSTNAWRLQKKKRKEMKIIVNIFYFHVFVLTLADKKHSDDIDSDLTKKKNQTTICISWSFKIKILKHYQMSSLVYRRSSVFYHNDPYYCTLQSMCNI